MDNAIRFIHEYEKQTNHFSLPALFLEPARASMIMLDALMHKILSAGREKLNTDINTIVPSIVSQYGRFPNNLDKLYKDLHLLHINLIMLANASLLHLTCTTSSCSVVMY